jgi:general secretion pathway protein M
MSTAAPAHAPALASLSQQLLIWWRSRTPRERQALVVVAGVLAVFAAWSILLEPALRISRESPAQLDQLEAQYQQMQRVAAQTTQLRGATRVSSADAVAALKAATERLGDHARLTVQGDRASLTLSGVTPQELRAWLLEVRSAARARPVSVQLQRAAQGYNGTLGIALGGST